MVQQDHEDAEESEGFFEGGEDAAHLLVSQSDDCEDNPRGQAPLTPIFEYFFRHQYTVMLHGARVDETPSARGSLAISAEMVKVSSQNRMAMIFRSFPNLGDGKREFGRRNRICRTQEIYL